MPSSFLLPETFDPGKHSILLCESIRSGADLFLNIYWKSEERQKAHLAAVQQVLKISDSMVVGPVVQIVLPRQVAFLRDPSRWGQALLTLAALFGALTAVRDYFADLFIKPDVFVYPTAATDDIRAGASIDLPLSLRNQAQLGQVHIDLQQAELQPVLGTLPVVRLKLDFTAIPQLGSGQSLDMHARGTAPSLPLNLHSPQTYRLTFEASAKEGWFRARQQVVASPRLFQLWPERSFETINHLMGANALQTDLAVYAGRDFPTGLQGEFIVQSPIQPGKGDILITQGGQALGPPLTVSQGGVYTSKLEFRTEPLQRFQRVLVPISIGFERQLTPAEWSAVQSSIRVLME